MPCVDEMHFTSFFSETILPFPTQPPGLHFTTGAIFGKFDDSGTNCSLVSILGHDS